MYVDTEELPLIGEDHNKSIHGTVQVRIQRGSRQTDNPTKRIPLDKVIYHVFSATQLFDGCPMISVGYRFMVMGKNIATLVSIADNVNSCACTVFLTLVKKKDHCVKA